MKQNERIRQIHNELNEKAQDYAKMYDIIEKERNKVSTQAQPKVETETDRYGNESEESEGDYLFDQVILSKLKF